MVDPSAASSESEVMAGSVVPGRRSAWRWLTEPVATLQASEHRRQARLLASLLVILIPLGLLSITVQLLIVPNFLATFLIVLGGLIVLTLAYLLSRTKYYRLGAVLVSIIPTVVCITTLLIMPTDVMAFGYLLIGVLLSSMFLSIRSTALVVTVNIGAVLLLPIFTLALTFGDVIGGPAIFLLIVSVLILSAAYHRNLIEQDRRDELAESEAKWRSLVQNAPDIIMTVDRDYTIQYINRPISGLPVEEAIGTNLNEWISAPVWDGLCQSIERVFQTGEAESHEFTGFGGPTRAAAWYSGRFGPLKPDAQVVGVMLIITDITERKQAEEALQESEERFRKLMEESPVGIEVFSPDGTLLNVNKTWQKMWRVKADDIVGRYNPLKNEMFSEMGIMPFIEQAFAGEQVHLPDLEFDPGQSNLPGRKRWVQGYVYHVRDDQGRIKNVVLLSEDITERRQAEEELQKYRDHLEELIEARTTELQKRVAEVETLNQTMSTLLEDLQTANHIATKTTRQLKETNKALAAFAYSVSHDLRAPLRSIDGFSQALLEDYQDQLDEVGQDYLRRVRAATQRMGQLIDDILDLSRITRSEMDRQRVDLSELAERVARTLEQTQPDREVEFVIAKNVIVAGDQQLLHLALENLIGNAWKFTQNQGHVKIEFGLVNQEGQHVYFVRDNGVGFDMAYADKLFGPFQRLHSQQAFEGTGIGLATVQRIIHRHSGQIWAKSRVGEGATFYFTLP